MRASQLVGKVAIRTEPVFISDDLIDIEHMAPTKILWYSNNGIRVLVKDGQKAKKELLTSEYDDNNWEEATPQLYNRNIARIQEYTHGHDYMVLGIVLDGISKQLNGKNAYEPVQHKPDVDSAVKLGRAPYVIPKMSVIDACDLINEYLRTHSSSEYVVYFNSTGYHRLYTFMILKARTDSYGVYYNIEMGMDGSDYDPDIVVISNDVLLGKVYDIVQEYEVKEVRSFMHLCAMMSNDMMFGLSSFSDIAIGEKVVVYSGRMLYIAEKQPEKIVFSRGVGKEHADLNTIALDCHEYDMLNAAMASNETAEIHYG